MSQVHTNGRTAIDVGRSIVIQALPVTVNLELYAGDDFFLDLTVTNPDGSPSDLEGVEVCAEIRASATTPTVMAAFTAIIDGNVIHLHLPNTQAVNLAARAVWDCHLTGTDVITLAAGRVTATPRVSRCE